MKQNIAKILAVVLVVALCTVFFTACVPSDPTKAEANLKEAGYTTIIINGSDVISTTALKAAAVRLEAVYDVKVTLTARVTGTNGDDAVTVYYCSSSKEATALKKATKKDVDKTKDELKKSKDNGDITEEDYKEAIENMKNYAYGAMGKAFWQGTKAGVKAAG